MVFQSYALYPHMTVFANIAYPLTVRGQPKAEVEAAVKDVARQVQLDTLLDRYPRQLSGGQRQRVALARAMIRRPAAFLMDEPLSNLDAKLRGYMRAELKHMQHQLGITTIYVTHDQIEAMTLAHRVALLEKGVLQQLDTPANIYNAPANLFVAGFIGSPPMNFLDGELADGRFSGAGRHLRDQDARFATSRGRRRPSGGLQGHGAGRGQDRRRGLCDRAYGRPRSGHLPGRRRHDHGQGRQVFDRRDGAPIGVDFADRRRPRVRQGLGRQDRVTSKSARSAQDPTTQSRKRNDAIQVDHARRCRRRSQGRCSWSCIKGDPLNSSNEGPAAEISISNTSAITDVQPWMK